MAKAKSKTRGTRAKTLDAIALLKADHRQMADWFGQFEKAKSDDRKLDLATRICDALKIHTTIEEKIFYPSFLDATEDKELHHEAAIEHDAKLKVLSEMIKHHVKEEEQPGGMFAEARKSDMDLDTLGAQMLARKGKNGILQRIGGGDAS